MSTAELRAMAEAAILESSRLVGEPETDAAVLARALLALLPFVRHETGCSSREFAGTPEDPRWADCDCGLDAALAGVGKEGK